MMLTLLKVVRAYAPERIEKNPQNTLNCNPANLKTFRYPISLCNNNRKKKSKVWFCLAEHLESVLDQGITYILAEMKCIQLSQKTQSHQASRNSYCSYRVDTSREVRW